MNWLSQQFSVRGRPARICRTNDRDTQKTAKNRANLPECQSKSALSLFERSLMPQRFAKNLERTRRLQRSLARWENEGGSQSGDGPGQSGSGAHAVPQLTNAELVQLQIRVIALENLMVALLADASEQQLARVRDIAASIFPRPGVTHRLTVHAAAQMEHLAQRSTRL